MLCDYVHKKAYNCSVQISERFKMVRGLWEYGCGGSTDSPT